MRLIDGNALRQTMESNLYWGLDSDGAILDAIDEAPTVEAVEVVRCIRCRKYDRKSGFCQFWHGARPAAHYCGEGERRSNGI